MHIGESIMSDDFLLNINDEGNSECKESDEAIATMALGIVSLIGVPFFVGWLGVLPILLGIRVIKADRSNDKDLKLGVYGLGFGFIALILSLALTFSNFTFINLAGW